MRDPARDRIRWHCRRGMLELDLVLNRFLDRHYAALGPDKVGAFAALLERTDPELLDLIMGHLEAQAPDERAVLALLRAA